MGLFGHFFLSSVISLLSPSLRETARYRLKYCLKGPFSPKQPTYNLDNSRARAYCTCSRCGWGLFGHFTLIYTFSPPLHSLWETARYKLKYCLTGPLNPNNQILHVPVSRGSGAQDETGPEFIKLFSCLTQLSTIFSLLINVKMPTIVGILIFMSGKNSMLGLSQPKNRIYDILIFTSL